MKLWLASIQGGRQLPVHQRADAPAQMQRDIAQQTNNHLVRHRLLILERLHADILKEYAGGDKARIARITIRSESGPAGNVRHDGQAEGAGPGLRLANFKGVSKKLEEALEDERMNGRPSLLRLD